MKVPWFLPTAIRLGNGASLGVLLVLGALCLFTLIFIVPRFGQIFADALPGKPLPLITLFILGGRWPLATIDLVWCLTGIFLWRRNLSGTTVWLNLGIILGLLQMGVTILALFCPMGTIITGTAEPR